MNQNSPAANPSLSWHVLGAGSLGGLWAARLCPLVPLALLLRQADFQRVELTSTNESVTQPVSGGSDLTLELKLTESGQTQSVHVAVESIANAGQPIQHLLVATKSYDSLAALNDVQHRIRPDTHIILMQNGLGSQDAVTEAFPHNPIFALSTTEGANRRSRFHIQHAGHGYTWIGPLTDRATLQTAQQFAQLFQKAGFHCEAVQDIRRRLWQKLAINCAINPFTAILDCRNGELPQQTFFLDRIDGVCAEIAALMQAHGYAITATELHEQVQSVIEKTAANVSSMLQDIRAGRTTEIDAINGYLVQEADKLGLACPINRELMTLVKALQPL